MRMSVKDPALAVSVLLWIPLCFAKVPAAELLEQNRLEEALPLCRQFEVLTGKQDGDSLIACSWVFYRADRPQSADAMLDRLRKQYPGKDTRFVSAYSLLVKKRLDEAREAIGSLVNDTKGTPQHALAQELNGEYYEAKGQIETAAFVYKQVIQEEPSRARAHWGLGRYYLSHGDSRRAEEHLEKVAILWPSHVGSRFNRAVLALNQNDTKTALKWLSECYRLDKADPGVLEQLGVLFEKRGRLDVAVRYWQRAAELSPKAQMAREKLSAHLDVITRQAETEQGVKRALSQIETLGAYVPDPIKIKLQKGILLRKLGHYAEAAREVIQYREKYGKDPVGMEELAICYVNLRLYDKALALLAKVIEVEPEEGMHYAWAAFTFESQGDLPHAREAWKKALELLKDPTELSKANRRLASIESKLEKSTKKR